MATALIIIVAVVAFNAAFIVIQNNRVPALGVTNGQFKPVSNKPNNVSTQTDVAEKQVATLPFKSTPEATMAAIKKAVETYGGAEIKQETAAYLYVVFTTPRMKFHDDVEFWLDTQNKAVHFRSSSRAGYSDMGQNRKRYDSLAELYGAL
ncbi:MAG: DUF1499 domain-containing protein [Reinekea sp.]